MDWYTNGLYFKLLGYTFSLKCVKFYHFFGSQLLSANFVSKLLNFDLKNRRMSIDQELLNDINYDPDFLKKVITGDESWVYGYDIETKAQMFQ